MKKLETLKKNYEFKRVLSKGKFYRGKFITIYLKKNMLNKNVIGIAVSSHVGKANKRNRIKRLIRENYRLNKDNLEKGYDIVFLWNKTASIEELNFFDIKHDMTNLFKRIGIIK